MSKNINTDGFNILPPAYITKLPRHLAGIIFKTRSYMLKIRTNMKTTNPDLSYRWCKQYQETQEHIITECTMTADIDLNKEMTNHNDKLIKEATQLTQIVNLLDKLPDTDVPIRPPDTDIPNRPKNILIVNNPPDPGRPPDRNIPNRPLDIDIPNIHYTLQKYVYFHKHLWYCAIFSFILKTRRSLKCAVNTRVGVEWEQPLLTKCPNGYAPHTASDSKVLTLPSRGGTVSTNGERRKARHWRSNQLLWTDGVHQLKRQFI